MTSDELSAILKAGMSERGLNLKALARTAGVAYETARRASKGEGAISLESTTKLLEAVGRRLRTEPLADMSIPSPDAAPLLEPVAEGATL